MLGVCEHAHCRGVGSTLVAMLLGTAKSRANLRKVQLTVFTDNAPAIRLYRSFGFEFEGLHDAFHGAGTVTSTPIRWRSFLAMGGGPQGIQEARNPERETS